MSTSNEEYATKDLHFAGFLRVKGIPMTELRRMEDAIKVNSWNRGSKKEPLYFIFEAPEACRALEHAYWEGEGDEVTVNIKDYITAVRELRSRIFAIRK